MSLKKITFNDRQIICQEEDTVLDALLRAQIDIPHACRQGVCQSCMLRSLQTAPPPAAQNGLKDVLRHQNYFLACLCYPQQDMSVSLGADSGAFATATVVGKDMLNADTLRLTLQCPDIPDYYAGQFVNLKRADGLTRSYSISNNRKQRHKLEFHIRRLAGGRFSEWAHAELAIGDSLAVSAAQGLCYYLPGRAAQSLLLIGSGSGLAPLAGIISEALDQGHTGPIHLYHGSRNMAGLYWTAEMRRLARQYPNFHYSPCVSGGEAGQGVCKGRAHELAMSALPDLKGWRIYLCGHPDMVHQAKRQAFLKGAAFQDIHADAFHIGATTPA
ncbi:MAG: 2Fe-2S iron-sulfur cluster-binding protein [Methylococcales bacterium]|nr:2Fe-2S iron-sulfur cluster-binding protein [Methylococcales bacterium]